MTPTAQKFNFTYKDQLFYNRWEYSIGFFHTEANCLRKLDHDSIDASIARRKQWREHSHQLLQNRGFIHSTVARRWNDITEETIESLHNICELLLATPYTFKIVVSSHNVWIYTNNLELINNIDTLPLIDKEYNRAIVTRPKNTILLKNSAYTHRSYFKISKLNLAEKELLCNFFVNQLGYIRVSPALTAWCDMAFLRTQDYFFIDHNGDSWLLMLALIRPGLIRKTMQIITK